MRSLTSERETNRALDTAETADGDLWVESSSWICQRPFISSRTCTSLTMSALSNPFLGHNTPFTPMSVLPCSSLTSASTTTAKAQFAKTVGTFHSLVLSETHSQF
jgi:hypothetical protein